MKTKNNVIIKISTFVLAMVIVTGLGTISNAVDHPSAASIKKSVTNKKSGTYVNSVTVKVKKKTKKATTYYTTNGKTPKKGKSYTKKYKKALKLKKTTTLKLRAYKGRKKSGVKTYKYKIKIASPSIQSKDNKDGTATVTISNIANGAKVYYTTNGKTATNKDTKYTKSFKVAGKKTVSCIAVRSKCNNGYAKTNVSSTNSSSNGENNSTIEKCPGNGVHMASNVETKDWHNIGIFTGKDVDYEYYKYMTTELDSDMEYANNKGVNMTIPRYSDYISNATNGYNYTLMTIEYCKYCNEYYFSSWLTDVRFKDQLPVGFNYTIKSNSVVISKEQATIQTDDLYKLYSDACIKYNKTNKWKR